MRINWPVWFIGWIWGFAETAYFGWNFTPHSSAELICDGIGCVILALAFVVPPSSASGSRNEV